MYALIANVMTDHVLRTGAKVYVTEYNGSMGRVEVWGLNKSGRACVKYMAWKRLTNIRTAWMPEHVAKLSRIWWDDREAANKVALELTELWRFVRSFHPDGRLLNDGISEGQAIREYIAKNKLPSCSWVSPVESVEERLKEIRAAGLYYARDAIQKPSSQEISSVGRAPS